MSVTNFELVSYFEKSTFECSRFYCNLWFIFVSLLQMFNMDLNEKRNAVKDIINKCNKMLRETTNAQTDEIKSRLESIQSQADIVCQLSAERLQQLEAALPLATSFRYLIC